MDDLRHIFLAIGQGLQLEQGLNPFPKSNPISHQREIILIWARKKVQKNTPASILSRPGWDYVVARNACFFLNGLHVFRII